MDELKTHIESIVGEWIAKRKHNVIKTDILKKKSIQLLEFSLKIYPTGVVEPLRSALAPQHHHRRTTQNTHKAQCALWREDTFGK